MVYGYGAHRADIGFLITRSSRLFLYATNSKGLVVFLRMNSMSNYVYSYLSSFFPSFFKETIDPLVHLQVLLPCWDHEQSDFPANMSLFSVYDRTAHCSELEGHLKARYLDLSSPCLASPLPPPA